MFPLSVRRESGLECKEFQHVVQTSPFLSQISRSPHDSPRIGNNSRIMQSAARFVERTVIQMKTKTPQEYDSMVQKASPRSPVFMDCLLAFLFGGAICTLGQAIANLFMLMGLTLKDARTGVSIMLILLSATLTAFGVFDDIAKHAGAGTLVPITGFANSMVSPAMEFKSEGFVTGLGAKMFVVSGPVLVFGISASVIYGIILFIIGLFQG